VVSIGEFQDGMRAGVTQIEVAVTVLATAKGTGEESVTALQGMSAHGTAGALNIPVSTLDEALTGLAAIKTLVENAHTQAEHAKGGGLLQRNEATGQQRVVPAPPPATATRPSRKGPDSRGVDAVKRLGWPKNNEGRTSARAVVMDALGNPIGGTWTARPDGPASDTSGFKEPWKSDIRYTIRAHVEGQVAATMRDTGITKTEVYLNVPPCGIRDRDPYRCAANIRAILPVGSTMTIWTIRERGNPQKNIYQGTGEAL